MGLREKLQEDLTTALRERNVLRRSVIRLVISAMNYADIAKGAPVDEAAVLGLVAREARQHRESIEAFTRGKREDLVEKERAELAILEGYLPQQMTREEVVEAASKAIAELGAHGPGDKGRVMGSLMGGLRGKADGHVVNEVVTELLSEVG